MTIFAIVVVVGCALLVAAAAVAVAVKTRRERRYRRIARSHQPKPFRKPLAPPDNPSNRSV